MNDEQGMQLARLFTLLQNASVISELQRYDKLRTSESEFTVDKPALTTAISRLMGQENRYRNFDAITQTVKELQFYLVTSEKEDIKLLVRAALAGIHNGINVLTETYSEDPRAVAKLRTIQSLVMTTNSLNLEHLVAHDSRAHDSRAGGSAKSSLAGGNASSSESGQTSLPKGGVSNSSVS